MKPSDLTNAELVSLYKSLNDMLDYLRKSKEDLTNERTNSGPTR